MICNTKSIWFLNRKIKDKEEKNKLYCIFTTMLYKQKIADDILQELNNILKNSNRWSNAYDILDNITHQLFLPKKDLKFEMQSKVVKGWEKVVMNHVSYGCFDYDEKIGYNKYNLFNFIFPIYTS